MLGFKFYLFFLSFSVVLAVKLRALCMQNKPFTTEIFSQLLLNFYLTQVSQALNLQLNTFPEQLIERLVLTDKGFKEQSREDSSDLLYISSGTSLLFSTSRRSCLDCDLGNKILAAFSQSSSKNRMIYLHSFILLPCWDILQYVILLDLLSY